MTIVSQVRRIETLLLHYDVGYDAFGELEAAHTCSPPPPSGDRHLLMDNVNIVTGLWSLRDILQEWYQDRHAIDCTRCFVSCRAVRLEQVARSGILSGRDDSMTQAAVLRVLQTKSNSQCFLPPADAANQCEVVVVKRLLLNDPALPR